MEPYCSSSFPNLGRWTANAVKLNLLTCNGLGNEKPSYWERKKEQRYEVRLVLLLQLLVRLCKYKGRNERPSSSPTFPLLFLLVRTQSQKFLRWLSSSMTSVAALACCPLNAHLCPRNRDVHNTHTLNRIVLRWMNQCPPWNVEPTIQPTNKQLEGKEI